MLRSIAISTLLLVGVSAAAHADVYRWVDDKGGVHYSDQWVPGSEVVKAGSRPHPTTSSSESAAAQQKSVIAAGDRASAQVAQANTAAAVKQDVTKARDQQCKDAKDRYEKAIQARRIYKPTHEGEKDADRENDRQYISDEEADAYRAKARTDMQEACGSAAK